ncbi:SET domain-containing protein-lysine N-methyltransferase [Mesorhizobium sp. WSM3224]|uniref:SET domain-containing protein-lysine N-methyltransferase n=1 Tax=Mesorhizobium sp. WSM3224 TaxID=1040986 RepID=UPI000A01AB66|nr:SET domain-containing protein-lysine N-methyltransferase [Mesorhizobium sp. WSM3224]
MIDKIFDRSNSVYIKSVPYKGRGLFANVPFKSGDIIDIAPTWEFDEPAAALFKKTGLLEYYFVRPDKVSCENGIAGYVVFGFISIVNHSETPNAKTVWGDGEAGAWASIIAIKDIGIDEEITHRYNNIFDYPSSVKFVK